MTITDGYEGEKNLERSSLQREVSADDCQIGLKETSVLILKCEVPGKKNQTFKCGLVFLTKQWHHFKIFFTPLVISCGENLGITLNNSFWISVTFQE